MPIIKAYSEGKDVEFTQEGLEGWHFTDIPDFCNEKQDYRVKHNSKDIALEKLKNISDLLSKVQLVSIESTCLRIIKMQVDGIIKDLEE